MVKVESKTTIRTVVSRFMRVNRGRNLIAILAIIMTTVMFTALFTAAMSVIKSQQQHEMRTVMDSSHIAVQDMTKEQYEKIRTSKNIQRCGTTIFAAMAENKELGQTQTEIRYGDQNGAESFMCVPETGRLPRSEEEIALSTITLNQLGVQARIGSKARLTCTLSGKKQTREFTLCGYWTGDPLVTSQMAWVSKDFCLKNCKKATETSIAKGDYEGDYNLSIWCRNIWKLTDDAEELSRQLKGTPARASANLAFERYIGEDGFPFGTVALILLIMFLSGYLIIFNVFRISVNRDIQTYGLLKSVGTTGRQLKIIVRSQALRLSAAGIPVGLVLGCLVGRAMVPYLLANVDYTAGTDKIQALSYMHPWILILSAAFALGTVFAGCVLPCRAAASLSPIEAMRFSEQASEKASRRTRGRISSGILAAENVKRTWKKAAIVVLSLALPIMVLNAAYTIVKGFDFDAFTETYISSDFEVSGLASSGGASDLHAVLPGLLKEIAGNDDILSAACVYDMETEHRLTDAGYENLRHLIEAEKAEGILEGPALENEVETLESRIVPAHVLGINEDAFDKMAFSKGACTWEEFSQGGQVIIGPDPTGLGSYYEKGDRLTLEYGKKAKPQKKACRVIAEGCVPYSLQFPFAIGHYFDYTFYVPEREYQVMQGQAVTSQVETSQTVMDQAGQDQVKNQQATGQVDQTGNQSGEQGGREQDSKIKAQEGAMIAGLDVKNGMETRVAGWLEQQIKASRQPLYVNSRMEIKEACDGVVGKYYLILGTLCAVLFVIGVLNFFNTAAVSIMTRSRELSLLEAVGMTKKQIRRMLVFEGILYLCGALLLADTLGQLAAEHMIQKTVGGYFFFQCHMSMLPSLLAVPALLLVAFAVPAYHYRRMCGQTIMERLRSL